MAGYRREEPPLAVLWDMDGVLVDSAPYHYRAWRETLATVGVDLDEASFRRTFGQRNDAILADLLGPDVSEEQVISLGTVKERRYRALVMQAGIAPLAGAVEWLRRLHARGIPQAVVSSAPRANITAVLEALGVADLFQALVSGEDVRQGKPHPESFLLAARRLGVPPERCQVVEDAPAGVEAARRAGMACLALTSSHPPEDLRAADWVVESLAGLPEDAFERLARLLPGGGPPPEARKSISE